MDMSHKCEDMTITTAIRNHLGARPSSWFFLPWSCYSCGLTNPGNVEHCSRGCPEGGMDSVLDTLLSNMEDELPLLAGADRHDAEIVSIQLAMEMLFSPHNRTNSGLLEDSFLTPVESMTCACTEALGLDSSHTQTTPATS